MAGGVADRLSITIPSLASFARMKCDRRYSNSSGTSNVALFQSGWVPKEDFPAYLPAD